jgi:hypothetical protein
MAHEAKRGPRPLILKAERRQWKEQNGITLRSNPSPQKRVWWKALLARLFPRYFG